ncbi:MAG: TolC family protein [Planctomycetota bacterium]
MRTLAVALLAGCAGVSLPPTETPYFREQLAHALEAPAAAPMEEGKTLRESAARLEPRAAAEGERIREAGEVEGLLDLASEGARAFVAQVSDPADGADALTRTPLDRERVLLAAYARNPDAASARASWRAAVRLYEQATYLEDVLLRYRAFTRFASPRPGEAMGESAFPYPGLVALKGEMIDREVAMAREQARMRLRDALYRAALAYHGATHQEEELKIREEQLQLAERLVTVVRARVAAGTSPQAELLEMEAERATAANDRAHALAALARARGELKTLLDLDPSREITLVQHEEPPAATPPVQPLLALARSFAPEIREARAEQEKTAVAIRMAEAMLFRPPAPAKASPGEQMGGVSPAAPTGFGPDAAWVRELRERNEALALAAAETFRAAERKVIVAHYELDAARRMFALAAGSTAPLARQAVEERLRLYESGRVGFAELLQAYRRLLEALRDVAAARHDYGEAEAMVFTAAGARPSTVPDGRGQ